MSLPRPSGLKAPSKIGRPTALPSKSGIPTPGGSRPTSALGKRTDGNKSGLAERYLAEQTHQHLRGPEPPVVLGPDDYKIGDRVWVGGNKPGVIAFIGETQFAPGEWAGIALDEPMGKNDGSVTGIRYFQCETNKGVFSRLSKLTRSPGLVSLPVPKHEDGSAGDSLNSSTTTTLSSASASNGMTRTSSTPNRPQTPRLGLSGTRSKSTSASSLVKESSSTSLQKGALPSKFGLKVGDKVLVSGTKPGVLRFIGPTDFAKGDWAGVELDDAQGKNDGAVAGKRYFECQPHYGLFAPLHKVTKSSGNTPSSQVRSLGNISLRMSRERSGSQDSISSLSSTASTASRSRGAKTGHRPATHNLNATASAIQKALKEKEEHIEQLLQERDLERADVARAAAMADEAESQLAMQKSDNERFRSDSEEQLVRMQRYIHDLERDKKEVEMELEDKRRKIEDLEFQVEEEVLSKDDLQSRTADDTTRIRELERSQKKEKERADKLEQELNSLKISAEKLQTRLKTLDEDQTGYQDQIEDLTYQLTSAKKQIKTYDMSRLEEGAKTSQVSVELDEKSARVSELEELSAKQAAQIRQLQDKLSELQQEFKDSETKKQKLQQNVGELNKKLELNESGHNKITEELRSVKSNKTELQQELVTSKEKVKELSEDRDKLERQIADLMKNSGDSSNQLSMMNEQVHEKNRKVADLQNDLSSSTQKIAKLNNELERLKQERERDVEDIVNKHSAEVSVLKGQLDDMQTELSRTKSKISKLSEDFDKEKTIFVQRKDSEIEDLKKHLSSKEAELSKQEVKTQAHKQVLDQITLDKEAIKFEKEKIEKVLKRVEGEKNTLNTELIQVRVQLAEIQGNIQQSISEKDTLEEQLNVSHDKYESELNTVKEIEKHCDELKSDKAKLVEERESLQQGTLIQKAALQQKDMLIDKLKKQVQKLRSETTEQQDVLLKKSISEEENSTLSKDLEAAKLMVGELQKALKQSQSEGDTVKAELEYSKMVQEERRKFEEHNKKLQEKLEELHKSHSEEVSSLESAKKSLKTSLDNSQCELNQKQQELKEYQQKVTDLENENLSLSGCKKSLAELEKDKERQKKELMDKINKLQFEALEIKNNANNIGTGDAELTGLVSEKEEQISFLNSVIVDMQKKQEEMKIRLEAMEMGVGAVVNGSGEVMMETSPLRHRVPPRLFCDICDVFDLHDTDDCPKQAMDELPGTHYHGDKHQIRPYCDICENEDNHTPTFTDHNTEESSKGNNHTAPIADQFGVVCKSCTEESPDTTFEDACDEPGDSIKIKNESVEWCKGHSSPPRTEVDSMVDFKQQTQNDANGDTDTNPAASKVFLNETVVNKTGNSLSLPSDPVINTSDDLDTSEEFDSAESTKESSPDVSDIADTPIGLRETLDHEDNGVVDNRADCLDSQERVTEDNDASTKTYFETRIKDESGLVNTESLETKMKFPEDCSKEDILVTQTCPGDSKTDEDEDEISDEDKIQDDKRSDEEDRRSGEDKIQDDKRSDEEDRRSGEEEQSLAELHDGVVMRQTKARSSVRNTYSQGDELEKSVAEQSKTESCVVS